MPRGARGTMATSDFLTQTQTARSQGSMETTSDVNIEPGEVDIICRREPYAKVRLRRW